jgi:Raf kinase inhibitor-like YbhB/YbcL family protein
MKLNSSAFDDGLPIPVMHTCDGPDLSPPLEWTGAPPGTRSFAVMVEDPDAPRGWVHWVLYGLPATTSQLPAGLATEEVLPGGVRQGLNDFGHFGYGGPCPPAGKPHHYQFQLYALDCALRLGSAAAKSDLLRAMEGHVIASAKLTGTYGRKWSEATVR